MKRSIPLILLVAACCTDSCMNNHKKAEQRKIPQADQGAKRMDSTKENRDESLLTQNIPAETEQKLAAKQQLKNTKIKANTHKIVQENPANKELRFNNPNLEQWSNTYLNDPQWQEQYSASVTYYLNSVQRNLDQNPQRKTDKSTIVSNYREKMSQTFYRSPEFVEFARSQFEKSKELSDFIVRNSGQITADLGF